MVMVVLVMGFNLGNRHEEGLFPIVGIKKLQCHIVDAIGPIPLEIDTAIVFIKDVTVIAVGGKLQHVGGAPIPGIAAPQFPGHGGNGVVDGGSFLQFSVTGQVPFSDVGGFVTGFLDVIGESLDVRGKHDVVAEAPRLGGVFSGLE